MAKAVPHLVLVDQVVGPKWIRPKAVIKSLKGQIKNSRTNYYQTDPITRASKTMAECVAEFYGATKNTDATKVTKKAKKKVS
jgi:NADH-ubiquinone oxidoreductase subunit G, C-terminal